MGKRWAAMAMALAAGIAAVTAGMARREAVETRGGAAIPAGKLIALTFDDGPRPGTTDRLLDGLRERGIPATFFVIGQEAEKYPDLVERMGREGHQVGNHTWSHCRLEDAPEGEIVREIGATDALLRKLLGNREYWLRPPYGLVRAGTEKLIPVPMVKWSIDPRDWESLDKEKVVTAAREAAEPNGILLLHDIYPTSVDAALELADRLRREGYEFVTVETLLRRNGITPVPGRLYRNGNP